MRWLILRGALDGNNKYNLKNDLDVWVQLFMGLSDGKGKVWYKGQKVPKNVTHIFARGAFDYYLPILKRYKNAYIIRYAAGKRLMPEKGIKYDLILVDSESQKKKVLKKFPKLRVEVFFKPAANHFKPMDIPKKYDVGFVAAIPEDKRKRVAWVYKTLPKDLKMLQLGQTPKKLKVPKNVKVKHCRSDKMPKMINQCKVVIVPYSEDDSGPRIISEAMACDVRPFVLNATPHCYGHHFTFTKDEIWPAIIKSITETEHKRENEILKHYNENFSMGKAVTHLRRLIDG